MIQTATASKTVAFISDQPLQNVAILADSALAPYLTFEPVLIASVLPGREQHIKITAAGLPPLGDLTGTVRIHSGHDTFRAFLNVTLHVMQPRIPELVFSGESVGNVAIATSNSGTPRAAFRTGLGRMYSSQRGPLGWPAPEFIGPAGGGYSLSLAIDSTAASHLAASLGYGRTLMYASNAKGSWTIEAVGPAATFSTLALTPTGQPCIAYSSTYASLSFACRASSGWTQEIIDPRGVIPDPWQEDASLAIDSAGKAHVIYFRQASHALYYATNTSGVWVPEPMFPGPTAPYVSYNIKKALTVDSAGVLHAAYADDSYKLMYCRRSPSGWTREHVAGDARAFLKIAVDPSGIPYIAYTKGDHDLNTIVVSNRRAGTWNGEIVNIGTHESILDFDMALSASAIHLIASLNSDPSNTFKTFYVTWLLGH